MSTPEKKPSNPDSDLLPIQILEHHAEEEMEEEEEGECGFCVYMKGGGCRDSFIEWEKCIEAAEKSNEDVVNKCVEVTVKLRSCMEAHADYYEPLLSAEKMAEQQFVEELEKEAGTAEQNADQSRSKEASKDSGKEADCNDK